jgi:hypothetical protein
METCWFCETRPADTDSALQVTMRGEKLGTQKTGFKQYTTYYDARTIAVPRCATCAANHRKRSSWNFPIGLAFLVPIGIGFAITRWHGSLGTLLDTVIPCGGAIVGLGIAVWLGIRLARSTQGTKNEGHRAQFPAVKELKEQGWTMQ